MEIALVRLWPGRKSFNVEGVDRPGRGKDHLMKIRHHAGASPAPTLGELADRSAQLGLTALDECVDESLTTPFEDWCEATGTHPEALGAWERFTQRASAG